MTEKTKHEGTRIDLIRRSLYPGTRRVAPAYGSLIVTGRESPRESFEMIFPRYQIEQYRGIILINRNIFKFFSGYRWSGLSIEAHPNMRGTVKNMYKTYVKKALRVRDRRNSGYLGIEARIILNEVLPAMQEFYSCTDLDLANHCELVINELSLAFENLRKEGKIQ